MQNLGYVSLRNHLWSSPVTHSGWQDPERNLDTWCPIKLLFRQSFLALYCLMWKSLVGKRLLRWLWFGRPWVLSWIWRVYGTFHIECSHAHILRGSDMRDLRASLTRLLCKQIFTSHIYWVKAGRHCFQVYCDVELTWVGYRVIFPAVIDGNLLRLVHLSNRFQMVDGASLIWQIWGSHRVGCQSERGQKRGSQWLCLPPCSAVVSSFLYRGRFVDYHNNLETTEEPDYLVGWVFFILRLGSGLNGRITIKGCLPSLERVRDRGHWIVPTPYVSCLCN